MTLSFALSASSHILIALGIFGLALTGEVSWIYLLASAASLCWSAFRNHRQGNGFLPPLWANASIGVIFVFVLTSIFLLKALPVQELAHFLLALQSVKLLAVKKGRDWLQLYLLSFFTLIAATALNIEIATALIFVFYLVWGPWVLVLFHLHHAPGSRNTAGYEEAPWPLWALFRTVGGMSGILLLLTLFFFITLPRFGSGYLGDLWSSGAAMTGFSDRLSLGEIASIKRNNAPAMRVKVEPTDLLRGRALYWRGIALDRFDGRKWERSRPNVTLLRPGGSDYFLDDAGTSTGPFIRQEVLLEPSGSPAIFFLGRPLSLTGSLRGLFRDSLGNLRPTYALPFQLSYEVVSDLGGLPKDELPAQNFLQLPHIDPRVETLSRTITEGMANDFSKARALEAYLKASYRYSLDDLPFGGEDPLALFLFDVRQGDCEYFSSALAIMLRQLGIPARVVNGYLGGEWNNYGDYYLVQQSHAHSWVEAYVSGRGWITLDSTPAGQVRRSFSLWAPVSHFVDYLRLRWYRYVIHFGFQDQYALLVGLKRPSGWFLSSLPAFSRSGTIKAWFRDPWSWIGTGLIALCASAAALVFLRWKRAGAATTSDIHATRLYGRFLALAKTRGFAKRPGDTPDDFSKTSSALGKALVEEFTALYQKARFCRPPPAAPEIRRMEAILAELQRGMNPKSPGAKVVFSGFRV